MLSILTTAVANAVTCQSPAPQTGGASMIVMLVIMFGVVYLLMIRPQQKQQKQHREFLQKLKKNDKVVLQSGIMGRVFAVEERLVVLEVADKVRISVVKHAVAGPQPDATADGEQK